MRALDRGRKDMRGPLQVAPDYMKQVRCNGQRLNARPYWAVNAGAGYAARSCFTVSTWWQLEQ
jgi:hypothetical protein